MAYCAASVRCHRAQLLADGTPSTEQSDIHTLEAAQQQRQTFKYNLAEKLFVMRQLQTGCTATQKAQIRSGANMHEHWHRRALAAQDQWQHNQDETEMHTQWNSCTAPRMER